VTGLAWGGPSALGAARATTAAANFDLIGIWILHPLVRRNHGARMPFSTVSDENRFEWTVENAHRPLEHTPMWTGEAPDGHLACLAKAGQGARTEQFRYLLLRLFREVSALCGW
jgi:hypothetical protein